MIERDSESLLREITTNVKGNSFAAQKVDLNIVNYNLLCSSMLWKTQHQLKQEVVTILGKDKNSTKENNKENSKDHGYMGAEWVHYLM